jgi:exo-1,4-beta-D-glucosaminidase
VWLNGSDNPPPANVETRLSRRRSRDALAQPHLSSASQTPTTVTGPSGVKMTGPYDYVAPSYWYVDKQNGGAYGFNTETSPGPAIPSLASREKFLPDAQAWPPTADWSLHNGGGEFANLKVFDEAMEAVYAKPNSAAEYERIADHGVRLRARHVRGLQQEQVHSTGVIQWMLNNAWPSMIWHLYDYYLDAGAGLLRDQEGLRAAAHSILLRRPLHRRRQQHLSLRRRAHATIHVHNLGMEGALHLRAHRSSRPGQRPACPVFPASLFTVPSASSSST